MAKSEDLRMAAVKHYLGSGDTLAETGKIFGVSATSVERWVDRYEETGGVANKPLNRGFKKIDPVKLRTYVKEHPDDTQQEIADAFGCCNQAVSKALKRLNVTRKKNAPLQGAGRGKSSGISGGACENSGR
jgi:transposase